MILKHFDCPTCGEFQALIPICTRCGKTAKRAGLKEIIGSGRPPGYASGRARRTDKILADEFERRGIVNFTNAGGVSRPTFSDSQFPGVYSSTPGQAPIRAGTLSDLQRNGIDIRNMTVDGMPWTPPENQAMEAPVGAVTPHLGPRANELLSNREVIGRTDGNGNQVE